MTVDRLDQQVLSLDHAQFIDILAQTENLLIIQDLDGVCMDLVKDPLNRQIEPDYVKATTAFDRHFYVLTNGEHIGKRGVNSIIERAIGTPDIVRQAALYLPGLAAGGVQWQNRQGEVEHPGVSEAELAFLAQVPERITQALETFFAARSELDPATITQGIAASVLDNIASPTANLNTLYELLDGQTSIFVPLQEAMQQLMEELQQAAAAQNLNESFFVHYAPNLGRDPAGQEIVWFAAEAASGTTDFQFMLKGGIKEAGVLALLNRYYHDRTGKYPLGVDFNVRQAPQNLNDLLALVQQKFDPTLMPTIVGVGDTVTSQAVESNGTITFKRGGSDRNFLQLIQMLGQAFNTGNITTYIDSSAGELKNRKPLPVDPAAQKVLEGPGDSRDQTDPLTLNVAFPGGYRQYSEAFQTAAAQRKTQS
ncbi:glucosylglycerol 3-phosphatase [filamentous cyanobacterium LEGE 11480]|uniref:Glucosylglycerol 3-phosphatase n=1 Tax=Romeriopsis navalis LEGE 11480 TaxID=2777977 RepID=A0A928VNI3_9CYAN|nr:glucosylglycerol 3-phosphatase [Romeriopsis navalis]MBE9030938.1 glucosylglycerol 3-phosphatase [Romeriopsis navalis LEGE 11480]